MKSIDIIQNEIIDDFNMFDDWIQKYEYLIELGKDLPLLNSAYKIEDNLIEKELDKRANIKYYYTLEDTYILKPNNKEIKFYEN